MQKLNPKYRMNLTSNICYKQCLPLIIFAVAMGFLEAIVVVYIRELYYPDGFQFPLNVLPSWLIAVEITREITTLLMLGAVSWISGRTFLKRLSAFLFLFGIWDIFYYIALKIFLNWPESLLTWDILFLIPITWTGPVLAPVICSVLMIIIALLFNYLEQQKNLKKIKTTELLFLIAGACIIYFTFTYDIGMLILKGNFLPDFFYLAENPEFNKILTSWEPSHFNWEIFFIGIAVISIGCIITVRRVLKDYK